MACRPSVHLIHTSWLTNLRKPNAGKRSTTPMCPPKSRPNFWPLLLTCFDWTVGHACLNAPFAVCFRTTASLQVLTNYAMFTNAWLASLHWVHRPTEPSRFSGTGVEWLEVSPDGAAREPSDLLRDWLIDGICVIAEDSVLHLLCSMNRVRLNFITDIAWKDF